MSYAPARVRFRAPWIAFLLVPLLALASVLVPAAAATAAAGPTITTEVTSASAADGISVRVVGTDFGAVTGAYAAVIVKGTEGSVSAGGGYAGFGYWMTPGAIAGGAFDKSIPVPTANLDKTKQYEVIVWQGHSNPDATTIYTRADVTVSAGQWDAIFPPPPPVPTITTEVTSASAASGATVRVVGTDFGAITGAYAAVIVKGTEASVSAGGGYAGFGYWMTPGAITGGAFDKSIPVPTANLDRTQQYEVIVWQGHTNPDSTTIYARADVTFSSTQWNILKPPAYGITVSPTSGLSDGDAVTVTGTFPATYTATNGSTQTTGVYLMYCVQPTGTPGTDATGRAGGAGNCIAPAQKWVIQPGVAATPGTTQIGTVDGGVWTFSTTIAAADLIGTKDCLDASTAAAGAVQCGIAVRLDHNSGSGANATFTFDQFVPVTFAAPAAPVPTITTSVTAATAADGVTVRVVGTDFGAVTGAYAALIVKGTEASVTAAGGYAGFGYWMTPGAITGGAFDKNITAATDKLDKTKQYEVIVWQGHTTPDATTIYARADVTITAGQWSTIFPAAPEEPGTGQPGTPPAQTPGAGSLSWGVKASFRSYITGPIANGTITTSGIGSTGSGYVFPQSGSASIRNGIGSVAYSGSVRFSGHDGALDLRLSDPQIRIDSATSGTLFVRVDGGTRVAFASLALGPAGKTTAADGSVRYSGVPATLTAAGADAFESFYSAGTALDPVTFTIGSAGVSLGGTTVVAVAASSVTAANTPDATPPATEGVTVTGSPVEGGTITATADGFQPNETGILAVIYSTLTVLADDLTADANGRVSWTGTLPRGLSGEHTLTFQGSVDRGIVLDIVAAAELQCTVADASLVWGFKETFRAYIDGSIANGEWTTDGDVSYETPLFTWAGGTGGADLEEGALDVQYSGSVRFTGHGGALDTTIANPRVVVDGDSAVLLLDLTGTTQAGDAVEAAAVEFAELDLSGIDAVRDGDTVTWADVPATLTAAGAEAFGTYPEGEALDPVTVVTTVDAECGEAAVEPTAEPTDGELEPEQASDGWPLWATILIVVVVLLLIAGLVIVLVRRNRTA